MRITTSIAAAVIALFAVSPASAVSINISTFSAANHASTAAGFHTINARENFEGYTSGERVGPFATRVGAFETVAPRGSSGTVSGTPGNTGTGLFLRNAPVYGRANTTAGGSGFLDSNDTWGMNWTISGLGLFDSVLFNLSDVGDAGSNMTILADGSVLDTIYKGRGNGVADTVLITFDSLVSSATIRLANWSQNDGFGIDDAVVASSVAPVPLPPAAFALLAGLGILAVAARKRRSA